MVTTRERSKPPPPPPEPETRKSGRARQPVKAYAPDNTVVGNAAAAVVSGKATHKNNKNQNKVRKKECVNGSKLLEELDQALVTHTLNSNVLFPRFASY